MARSECLLAEVVVTAVRVSDGGCLPRRTSASDGPVVVRMFRRGAYAAGAGASAMALPLPGPAHRGA
ncbi:hypothetical protein ABT086_35480, partial [Streptomyces mirabilis]